jgi:hypothetical protein
MSGYLLRAPRDYVYHGLVLGSDWTSCQLSSLCIILVCLGPPSILLFVPLAHVSHVHPSLPTQQLKTCVQVNNMALLHLMYNSHTYLHHIRAANHFLLHTSSTLLARPAGPDPSCREQVYLGEFQSNSKLFLIMFQGTSHELLAKSLQTNKNLILLSLSD